MAASFSAAATTAYYCGQSALESGWLGWHLYMKEFASDVIAFKRTDYYTGHTLGGPFPAGELIPYETVFERMKGVCGTHTLYAFDSYSERYANEMLDRAAQLEANIDSYWK